MSLDDLKMKWFKFIGLIILLQAYLCYSSVIEDMFEKYIKVYNKTYRDQEEYERRLMYFEKNVAIQFKLNQNRTEPESAWYGPTKFSDLSQQEFTDMYLSSYKQKSHIDWADRIQQSSGVHGNITWAAAQMKLPDKVDWRKKNIVTGARDQGHCGSCWAFAVIEAVESMHAKAIGKLTPLSVQEMMDCSYGYKNLCSCKGGNTCQAFDWLLKANVHIETEKQYPTKDVIEACKVKVQEVKGVQIKNYTCETYVNQEFSLLSTLASVGPVSVSVDATTWNNYQGGIIQYHCGEVVNNHAALIVGYDLTGLVPYYIVKNSWGTSFGHDGYLYIAVGGNVCGIAEEVSTVETDPKLK